MRFSVFNVGTRMFDYYETPELATKSNAEKPDHLRPRSLGATVEQSCWPLPPSARPVGSGEHAVGRVAISSAMALGASDSSDMPIAKGVLLAVAGALAVKFLMPRGRR